jgi:hypothetical protein
MEYLTRTNYCLGSIRALARDLSGLTAVARRVEEAPHDRAGAHACFQAMQRRVEPNLSARAEIDQPDGATSLNR